MAKRKSGRRRKKSSILTGLQNALKPKPKPAAARKQPAKQAAQKTASQPAGMSLDRKLDITGVALILIGGLTLFGLLSPSRSGIAAAWVNIWRSAFGWGVYIFPLALILIGIWLVARNFENVPRPDLERLIGVSVLFILLLVVLHTLISPADPLIARELADQGKGGGRIGAGLMIFLATGLGMTGLVLLVIASGIIGLALALDTTVVNLFTWLPPLVLRVQDAWDERQARRKEARAAQAATHPAGDYTPPPEPDVPSQPIGQPARPLAETQIHSGTQISPLAQAVIQRTDWVLPRVEDVLEKGADIDFDDDLDRQRAELIEETLASFGAPAHVVEINRGPTITQYGVEPDFIENRSGRTRVRVSKIASLADDLSLVLAAQRIRIQAPVPGKGYIGIEVPNEQIAVVALRDVIESKAYRRLSSPLRFALGQDVAGNPVAADLAGMPHLLVAGATGSGKSVCVNAIITCMMIQNTPETLRFIMVDPKRVELTGYNGIPHLLAPVVTDIERVVGVLQWVTREMDSRYQKFADAGARNIADYNMRAAAEKFAKLPFLVLVIDELADLMMVAPDQTERLITRMAQLARATGIHLVISTQRPSVDVVTGLIKANFPARIAFAVASGTDSRVILDQPGAERLLGSGDMLFQAPDAPAPVRLQGVFVSDPEILRAVQYWRAFAGTTSMAPVPTGTPADAPPPNVPLKQQAIWKEMEEQEEKDPLYQTALSLVRERERASISMLQRRLKIGYTRAARLIEQMEADGIIGPPTEGSKPREVLDYGDELPPAGQD
ncbi:MAG: DNA translocase FtsK 4TM domain-containing protein [Anaerolineales bacterium]|nr:DNA translocase FtsK 4TM domain-containing protein [Anaerolineales bacterium]